MKLLIITFSPACYYFLLSHMVRDQVSHPYKATCKIIVLHTSCDLAWCICKQLILPHCILTVKSKDLNQKLKMVIDQW
jgi:hypothetical protein